MGPWARKLASLAAVASPRPVSASAIGIACVLLLLAWFRGAPAVEDDPMATPLYGEEYAGGFLDVEYAKTAPVIDGDAAEWQSRRWIRVVPGGAGVSRLRVHHLRDDGLTEPPGTAGTAADLSGAFALQWDEDWLYLAVRVTDNVRDIQSAREREWYLKDGVQFFLDLPLDGDGPDYVVGDHSFAFVADPAAGDSARWWRRGVEGKPIEISLAPPPTQLAVRLGERGDYVLEAAIPMDALIASTPAFARPIADRTVGYMLLITDPDGGPRPYGGQLIYGAGGQLIYGADDDDDAYWPRLRFKPPGAADRPLGRIEGAVRWEDESEGTRLGKVRIESLDGPLWVQVRADSQGVYGSDLPAGDYRVTAGYRRHDTSADSVEVSPGKTTTLPDLSFPRPPLGRRVTAGSGTPVPFAPIRVVEARGRTVPAGPGTRKGLWHSFDVSDGLAANTVNGMIQDRHGNLWFATEAGLCRYDGLEFTTFTTQDGLPSNWVLSVLEDRQGQIWVGTGSPYENRGGISRFDGTHISTYRDSLAGPRGATVIFEDRDGHLWFGTWGGGLLRYDGTQATRYTVEDGLTGDAMSAGSILQDRQGHLWFAIEFGPRTGGQATVRLDGEAYTIFDRDDGFPDQHRPRAMVEDRDGRLWFGSGKGPIARYDGRSIEVISADDGFPLRSVDAAVADRDGHLWFAGGAGVCRYDGTGFTHFTEADGLAQGSEVSSILEDREGNLWFGTGKGVSRYEGRSLVQLRQEQGWIGDRVLAVMEDRAGRLWVSTQRIETPEQTGVSILDRGAWVHTSPYATDDETDAVPPPTGAVAQWKQALGQELDFWRGGGVRSMLLDRQDRLWLGYGLWRPDGLSGSVGLLTRIDGSAKRSFFAGGYDESGKLVGALLEDRQGRIWVGTHSGVQRFDGDEPVPVGPQSDSAPWEAPPGGLPLWNVTSLMEDRQGRVWAGSHRGVGCFAGDDVRRFTAEDGLAHDIVYAICQDRRGDLWFGTESGVSRYDGKEFTNFTTADGLTADRVVSIVEDPRGRLLFGTLGGGVAQYDGLVFQSLQDQDGLTDNRVRQLVVSREGDIVIATDAGLTRYRPGDTPPPVRITDVVADRRYGPVPALSVPHTQRLIGFEFLGQSYKTARDHLAYAYRLDGYDGQWRWTRDRRVEYAGVPEGSYTFQVKAVDRDLTYSATPATVAVEVFHQSTIAPYRIVDLRLDDLFASFYPTYAHDPFGSVTVANDTPDTARALLRLYLPDFMRRPTEQSLTLAPKSERSVELTARLDPAVLAVREAVQTGAEVELAFAAGEQTIALREAREITVHGRGTLVWDQIARAASFVTSADPAVAAFARPVLAAFEAEATAMGDPVRNLVQAMVLFAALEEHGVRYVADANTPYSQVAANHQAIDHIRYPAETLQYKAGDCDDLTVLYAALLENAGIPTALVDYPGHIFLLFDSGVSRERAYRLPLDEGTYAIRGERLWIPVEITLLGDSFHQAWVAGMEELEKLSAIDRRQRVVDTAQAWDRFPAEVPAAGAAVEAVPRHRLDDAFATQYGALRERIDAHIAARYLDPLKLRGDDDALRLQLIQLYLVLRRYDTAISTAESHLLDAVSDKAVTLNQLGVAYYLKGELTRAALSFKQAIALRPGDTALQRNLDLALRRLGKAEVAAAQIAVADSAQQAKGAAAADDVDDFYWLQ